jgi:cobyrinic acid a,c-diamide synthase
VRDGLPVYAECGGLMYLARGIHWQDTQGARYAEMTGALPFDVEMTAQPQGHGYVLAECQVDTPFFPRGSILRGHEFHHSHIIGADDDLPSVLRLERGVGVGAGRDGLVFGSVYAGYTHLHAYGSPEWAPALVRRAAYAAERNARSGQGPGR